MNANKPAWQTRFIHATPPLTNKQQLEKEMLQIKCCATREPKLTVLPENTGPKC